MPLMVSQFLSERGTLLRGMAHPAVFQARQGAAARPLPARFLRASSYKGRAAAADSNPSPPTNHPQTAVNRARPQGMGGGDGAGPTGGPAAPGGGAGGAGFGSFLATYGAVPVSAKGMFTLLASGESVLLYPGGVREAYKGRDEAYTLFWPERQEFVRMASRFGATIVPFSGAHRPLAALLGRRHLPPPCRPRAACRRRRPVSTLPLQTVNP
jgi:hypothetical protein